MFNYTKIWILLCIPVAFFIRSCDWDAKTQNDEVLVPIETETPESSYNESKFAEYSEITRKALIKPCGSCHQSTLESHKPGAIKIFDLDQGGDWHTSLSLEHLEGIIERTQDKNTITKQQKEIIMIFMELKESELK